MIANEAGDTVTGNQIYDNAISHTTGLAADNITGDAIHDIWGGTPQTGNSFYSNLLYDNPGGIGRLTAVSAYNNSSADPQLTDPAGQNFQPQSGSPAAAWVSGTAGSSATPPARLLRGRGPERLSDERAPRSSGLPASAAPAPSRAAPTAECHRRRR